MLRAEEAVQKFIRIQTDDTELILQVAENGRLYQSWFGERLLHESDLRNLPWAVRAGSDGSVSRRGWEVYSGSGNEDYFEPAIAVTHNDGNPSTWLYYVSSHSEPVKGGTHTEITLRDDQYPVEVTLHYVAYAEENVFKTFIMLKDIRDYPVMRATELKFYQEYAPDLVEHPPASTILQAGCLARPEFLVEIECNAVVNRKKD